MTTHEPRRTGQLESIAPPAPTLPTTDPSFPVSSTEPSMDIIKEEVSTGALESLRTYGPAVRFCLLMMIGIVMQGYGLALLPSFFAFPAFTDQYGVILTESGDKHIPAAWQSALTVGAQVGSILGMCLGGFCLDKFGVRRTLMVSCGLVSAIALIEMWASKLEILLITCILMGLPYGVIDNATTTYVSDVAPTALRPFVTSLITSAWVCGSLLSFATLRAFITVRSTWAYRIPNSLLLVFAIFLIVTAMVVPESPWWLVRQGKYADAQVVLSRLRNTRTDNSPAIIHQIATMKSTNDYEIEVNASSRYWDCFKGTNARRTEISMCVSIIQAVTGSTIASYSVLFFHGIGLSTHNAFEMSLASGGIELVGSFLCFFLLARIGRRTLYLSGLLACFVLLLIIALCGIPISPPMDLGWVITSMVLLFTLIWGLTIGPVCYPLMAEMPSTRLKAKTIALSRSGYVLAGICEDSLMPHMIGHDSWHLGAKVAFVYAGSCVLGLIWAFFRLPEPRHLISYEIDLLFEKKVSARRFREYDLDIARVSRSEPTSRRVSVEKV